MRYKLTRSCRAGFCRFRAPIHYDSRRFVIESRRNGKSAPNILRRWRSRWLGIRRRHANSCNWRCSRHAFVYRADSIRRTIPFQFFIAFTPVIEPPLRKSHPTIFYFYWSIYPFTTPVIFLGFVAVFCHFACWLGALFFITSLAACLAFWYCAVKYFGQSHAEK